MEVFEYSPDGQKVFTYQANIVILVGLTLALVVGIGSLEYVRKGTDWCDSHSGKVADVVCGRSAPR